MLTLREAEIILLMAAQRTAELQELHLVMNQKHSRHMFFKTSIVTLSQTPNCKVT